MGAAHEHLARRVGEAGLEANRPGIGPQELVEVGREECFVAAVVGQRFLFGAHHLRQERVVLVEEGGGEGEVVGAAVLVGIVEP